MSLSIDNFLTKEEVADILRIDVRTVSNLVSAQKIAAKRGRPVLISKRALAAYINRKTTRALR